MSLKMIKNQTVYNVIYVTSMVTGLSVDKILHVPKKNCYVRARAIISWILKFEYGMSVTEISRELGYQDHTTVSHLITNVSYGVYKTEEIIADILINLKMGKMQSFAHISYTSNHSYKYEMIPVFDLN